MVPNDFFRFFQHRKYLKTIFPISFTYGIYAWGWGLTTPIFAILINSITKDIFLTGIIIAIWGLVGLITDIPFGILCDKWNIKKILQFCLFFYIFIAIGYALAANFWELLAIRIMHSAFGALMWVAIWTYLFGTIKQKHAGEEMGFFSTFYDFAATVSPLIGGIIATIWFVLPFYVLSVCCGISLLIVSITFKDFTVGQKGSFLHLLRHELNDLKKIGWGPLGRFIVLTVLSYSVIGVVSTFLPILLHNSGIGYESIGLVLALAILPAVLMEVPIGNYIDHKRRGTSAVIGLLGLGISLVPLIFTLNFSFVLVAIIFYGISSTLIYILVNALASAMALKDEKGAFSGTATLFKDVGNVIGPFFGGLALKLAGTQWTMSFLAFVCVAGAAVFYFTQGNRTASAKIL